MNPDTEERFWSALGETARPRLSEAQWTAQRARILARLTPADSPRLRAWAAVGAAAFAAAAWLLVPQSKTPQPEAPIAGPVTPPVVEPVAEPIAEPVQIAKWDPRVTMVEGQVTIFSRGAAEGVPAAEGMPLEEGDNVRTGVDGRAELALSSDSVIALGPASVVTLSDLEPKQTLLNLDLGTLVAKLQWKGTPGRHMDIMTPTAVAAVRGTEFGVTVQEGGETSVGVFDEGRVAVRTVETSAVEETMLEPHQEVRVPRGPISETETRDGRNFLRVGELAQLKPFREQIERIRQRPEELSQSWKGMDRPQREELRSRMMGEHQARMQAMPAPERQAMMERLRRPENGARPQRPEGFQGEGRPQRPEGTQGEGRPQRPDGTQGEGRPQRPEGTQGEGRHQRPEGTQGEGRPQRPEGTQGEGRHQRPEGTQGEGRPQRPEGTQGEGRHQRPEGTQGEGRPQRPEGQFPREQGGLEPRQRIQEGREPHQRQEPGRERRERREGGMQPPGGPRREHGGQDRKPGGQQRGRGGPGRERRQ